jgi:hypothetical protein
MQPWEVVAIIVVVLVLVAVLGWSYSARQRSRRLRRHFGHEYDRTLADIGDRRRAESDLSRRVTHANKLDIQPLTDADQMRFATQWNACQTRFVDDPVNAVYQADELVLAVMQARGYPARSVVERFEDVSATHPYLATDYRQAREILARYRRGEGSTEEMRQAMVHYRKIFSELLGEGNEKFKRAS